MFLGGLLLALAVAFNGCHQDPPKPDREPGTVDVRLGSRTYRLWVAATENTRRYGLMKRESMPADRGMIFVFRTQQPLTFWMKDTLIPLDMVWVSARGIVTTVAANVPATTVDTPEAKIPHRNGRGTYVIELAAGEAAHAGIKTGVLLDVSAVGKAKN
jgi:uncharacterized protein